MEIGVIYPQIELGGDPAAVREYGLAAEQLGYDHLLAYDHVVGATHDRTPKLWGPYTEQDPFHDPFIMFAYLAGLCAKLKFVTGVIILPQRQTALVAKQVADLDLLSGERLRLGVGVGWNYVEYEALGQDFATRGKRADEQIELLKRYWSEPLVSFEGRFDRVDRGNILPRPKRAIPLWVGGFTEPAFRRAAKYGDGFIYAGAEAPTQRERVHQLLSDAGRSADGFGAELMTNACRSIDAVLSALDAWREAGGTHASVCTMGMGLDSISAHVDFIAEVRGRLDAA